MSPAQWARLSEDVDCGLRRGAWYPALKQEKESVLIEVGGRRRSFSRGIFEIVASAPSRWTIVSHAGNENLIPARWNEGYAVCPCCRTRQLLLGHPAAMQCERCEDRFEIAWNEGYLAN